MLILYIFIIRIIHYFQYFLSNLSDIILLIATNRNSTSEKALFVL
jgi:hypothetical protein